MISLRTTTLLLFFAAYKPTTSAFLPPLESMISLRTTTLLLFFAAYKPTTSAQLVDMNHKQQAECLKSVENYVQNITDTASECEGLMAAYKDGCSPYNEIIQNHHSFR